MNEAYELFISLFIVMYSCYYILTSDEAVELFVLCIPVVDGII